MGALYSAGQSSCLIESSFACLPSRFSAWNVSGLLDWAQSLWERLWSAESLADVQ